MLQSRTTTRMALSFSNIQRSLVLIDPEEKDSATGGHAEGDASNRFFVMLTSGSFSSGWVQVNFSNIIVQSV